MSPILIANWKMQLSIAESVAVFERLEQDIEEKQFGCEVVVCPTFPALGALAPLLRRVFLGAQDCFWKTQGAFTGQVSPVVLRELGCTYVIIGHSERRSLGETDAIVEQKLSAALASGLTPILCVGETQEERREGKRDQVLMRQVTCAVRHLEFSERMKHMLIAYEPVWVIGRGQAVPLEDIRHARAVIETALREHYAGDTLARAFRVLYGGSVDPSNIAQILREGEMEGALVGGASQKSESLRAMLLALCSHSL